MKSAQTKEKKSVPEPDGVAHHNYFIVPDDVQKSLRNHPLCGNLFVSEIGYEETAQFYPIPKKKIPNQYVLVYVAQGEGWYEYEKEIYLVGENDFFVLPARHLTAMGISTENPWRIYWAIFSGLQASKITRFLMAGNYQPKKAKPLVGRIAQFNDILHHLEFMNNIENLVYANSRFYSFLCSFKLQILSAKKSGENDRVIQTIEYMRENLSKVLTLEELADSVNFSVSNYCAVFKKKTAQTPLRFFNSMKIQRACQWLQNPDQTIKDVAYNLGFFDQYHFSKVFKQTMGISPKQFKERIVK